MREVNQDVYHNKQWQYQEGEYTVTRTSFWGGPGCHDGCGVLYYVKNDRVEKVEGDPNCPYNNGRLCVRCLDQLEAVYHQDRITYPMKRAGERGEDKWERITWDEALKIIKKNVNYITEKYGSRAITTLQGTGRNCSWPVSSLGNLGFGTPNTGQGTLSGDSCYGPRMMAMETFAGTDFIADMGQQFENRFDDPRYKLPELVLIWGCNPIASNADGFYGHWIIDCMRRGTKIITVDPRITWMAAKAEVALQLRPGTDSALAMGIAREMIANGWYDKKFVDEWCYGFSEFKAAVEEWTLEYTSEVTWVPVEKIIKAADIIGHSRFSLQWGVALDMQKNGVEASHAVEALIGLTGSLDVPGTNIIFTSGFVQNDIRMNMMKRMDPGIVKDKLGCDGEYPLRTMGYAPFAMPEKVLSAIEKADPYPVKMAWIQSSNTISNCAADSKRWYDAFKSLDFIVVVDLFKTPTAVAFADLLLPSAMSCERDSMRAWWTPFRAITKVVDPLGESKDDETIMLEVGKYCAPDKFPWENTDEMRADFLENLSSTSWNGSFDDLRKTVWDYFDFEYEKYKKGLLRSDGQLGFNTPTSKIELVSTIFEMVGLRPEPFFTEPTESPYNSPEEYKEYPFVLTTGQRSFEFFHSENRQMARMRELHPWPLCEMNPEDANALGLCDGEWVYIENPHGKIKQKLHINKGMLKGVMNVEHGWWFPEREAAEPSLFGTFDSQANCLTVMDDVGVTGWGAPYKTQLAKVYRCVNGNPEDGE